MEKEETQAASRKEDLPASVDRGGNGLRLSLKGTEQIITPGPQRQPEGDMLPRLSH